MYENRFITAEQRDEAKAEELRYRSKAPIPPRRVRGRGCSLVDARAVRR
jgi:membrane peptidoglycan carboxypeptidase